MHGNNCCCDTEGHAACGMRITVLPKHARFMAKTEGHLRSTEGHGAALECEDRPKGICPTFGIARLLGLYRYKGIRCLLAVVPICARCVPDSVPDFLCPILYHYTRISPSVCPSVRTSAILQASRGSPKAYALRSTPSVRTGLG